MKCPVVRPMDIACSALPWKEFLLIEGATQGIRVTSGFEESTVAGFATRSLSEVRKLIFLLASLPAKGRKSFNTISKVNGRL